LRTLALGLLGMFCCNEVWAQYRVAVDPSIEVSEVHDDNLFYAQKNAASDLIFRVSPGLGLRVESPRLTASTSFEFDNDRYGSYSSLSNRRARQRGLMDLQYRATPRLTVALNGAYTDTTTPAELNLITGLATTRVRAQQLNVRPTGSFRVSSVLTAHIEMSSTRENLTNGMAIRAQKEKAGIERRLTPRDLLSADYEQGRYVFDLNPGARTTMRSSALVAGWTHDLTPTSQFKVQAGPRIVDGSTLPELAASFTQRWKFSTMTISGLQTQTTFIGLVGTVQTQDLDARFTYHPTRSLTAYAWPAAIRILNQGLQVRVYQLVVGARYAITPFVGVDMTYGVTSQRGAIDRLHPDFALSHNTFSLGLTTRLRNPETRGPWMLR
jgi:hypothetical protein